MFNCADLIHPFQNDPGVSQRQRIMDDLLSGSAKIDGRTMADLLDYFVQLSRHVNYYDTNLSISDWQPFFQKSIPFSLAAIIKYDRIAVNEKIDLYNKLFDRRPSKTGLQLLLHYLFHQVINRVNTWHVQLKDSDLPAAAVLEKLIRDKLRVPLSKFICYQNAAVRWYCVKPLDFLRLAENEVWGLDLNKDAGDCKPKGKTKHKRLISLQGQIKDLAPTFLDAIRIIADVAAQNMEQSFFPLKEELQKKHTPHLALLFAFLKLFQHLQNDLNKFTKKHLDFFYKQVLKFKTRDAIADKVHIVFEIQKQLDKYLLKKGLLVKDGKDTNKAEILFALDNEIVVNKTQVAEKRTLYLNNQDIADSTYVEGVYMAPNADKADGIQQDFADDTPKSFPTVGAKYSKYKDPEKKRISPYPNARIGFILASPVLLLNEGTRNVTISLACQLNRTCNGMGYPASFSPELLFSKIRKLAGKGFYLITQNLIDEAAKKGISNSTIGKLQQFLFNKIQEGCCGNETLYNSDTVITARNWRLNFYKSLEKSEKTVLSELFRERRIFKILFSGKDEWILPSNIRRIRFSLLDPVTKQFTITIKTRLRPDKPAVTFFDKEKLKEDFNTTQPLVKVELDDDIKIFRGFEVPETSCCLQMRPSNEKRYVSFYHFFRDVKIIDKIGSRETKISVRVCGLRNVVVQNDESVQDVNGPVYPFGTRPRIDANFYIGSQEIFLKKWSDISININWKDLPVFSPPLPDPLNGKPFQYYYNGYQDFLINSGVEINTVIDNKFRAQVAVLQDGIWNQWKHSENCLGTGDPKCQLFQKMPPTFSCDGDKFYTHQFQISRVDDYLAPGLPLPSEELMYKTVNRFDVTTRHGFLRLTLKCQDFQHDKYPFVLARQMTALGKLPEIVDGAVYYGVLLGGPVPQFETIEMPVILQEIINNYNLSLNPNLLVNLDGLIAELNNLANPPQNVNSAVWTKLFVTDDPSTPFPLNDAPPFNSPSIPFLNPETHSDYYGTLKKILDWLKGLKEKIENFKDKGVVIPKEPWTPVIKQMSLGYTATAGISDLELIHLYPYKDTFKREEISLRPGLFATFCDEGTLFIGLKDLIPGSNVNILFQLAEATADSESDREEIAWHYLDNNQWKLLRNGFEVLDDATDGLTTSGIVQFALPSNMTKDNTILPKDLHWMRASVPKNSRTVSETIGIYTQAVRATFTNDITNDKLRLSQPLAAGSVSRLNDADANLKKLTQPYDTFGGRVPEAEGHFYVRVSEVLRHKGRAIQKFDYERLVLELFPQLFKAKCINHSFALNAYKYKNDFPIAPGYVILAVIPDLKQLKAAQSFEPRVPVSMLEDIQEQLKKLTSPFVRFRAMNPRYEKIHFCLTIKLVLGKDENYYKEKMKQDLREFLAPWAVGQYEKLTFGQCVSRSVVVRFLESRDYVDYILELLMRHNDNDWPDKTNEAELASPVCPKTPRSILIAGDIDVCIPERDCEEWQTCKNAQGELIDCCGNKKIPIADYCVKDIPG